jgi:hypothetical protein
MIAILDTRPAWEALASAATAIALWASTHASATPIDPVDDISARLRRPLRWPLANPLRAFRRALGRR